MAKRRKQYRVRSPFSAFIYRRYPGARPKGAALRSRKHRKVWSARWF